MCDLLNFGALRKRGVSPCLRSQEFATEPSPQAARGWPAASPAPLLRRPPQPRGRQRQLGSGLAPWQRWGRGKSPCCPSFRPRSRELERSRLRVSVVQAFRLEGHPQAKITVPDSSWVTVCKPGVSVWLFYDFEQYWRWEQGK